MGLEKRVDKFRQTVERMPGRLFLIMITSAAVGFTIGDYLAPAVEKAVNYIVSDSTNYDE